MLHTCMLYIFESTFGRQFCLQLVFQTSVMFIVMMSPRRRLHYGLLKAETKPF